MKIARQQAITARFEGISDLRARGVHVFMTREEWEGDSPRDVDRQLAELGLRLKERLTQRKFIRQFQFSLSS